MQQNIKFERFIDFFVEMIEKYGDKILMEHAECEDSDTEANKANTNKNEEKPWQNIDHPVLKSEQDGLLLIHRMRFTPALTAGSVK